MVGGSCGRRPTGKIPLPIKGWSRTASLANTTGVVYAVPGGNGIRVSNSDPLDRNHASTAVSGCKRGCRRRKSERMSVVRAVSCGTEPPREARER